MVTSSELTNKNEADNTKITLQANTATSNANETMTSKNIPGKPNSDKQCASRAEMSKIERRLNGKLKSVASNASALKEDASSRNSKENGIFNSSEPGPVDDSQKATENVSGKMQRRASSKSRKTKSSSKIESDGKTLVNKSESNGSNLSSSEITMVGNEGIIEESVLNESLDDCLNNVLLEESILHDDGHIDACEIDSKSEEQLLREPMEDLQDDEKEAENDRLACSKLNGIRSSTCTAGISNVAAESTGDTSNVIKTSATYEPVESSHESVDKALTHECDIPPETRKALSSGSINSDKTNCQSVETPSNQFSTNFSATENHSEVKSKSGGSTTESISKQHTQSSLSNSSSRIKVKEVSLFNEALRSLEDDCELGMVRPPSVVPCSGSSILNNVTSSLTELRQVKSQTCKGKGDYTSTGPGISDTHNSKRLRPVDSGDQPDLKKIRIFKPTNGNDSDLAGKPSEEKEINREMVLHTMEIVKVLEKAKEQGRQTLAKKIPMVSTKNKENNEVHIIDDFSSFHQGIAAEEVIHNNVKKLKKIKRKDLEIMIIELFAEKVFYENSLGEEKDSCKKLERALIGCQKKLAQFHKELEDLNKVTARLHEEHSARKNQIIAPVKVKRSVGIQANPSIIAKGIMHTSSMPRPRHPNSKTFNGDDTGSLASEANASSQVRNSASVIPEKQITPPSNLDNITPSPLASTTSSHQPLTNVVTVHSSINPRDVDSIRTIRKTFSNHKSSKTQDTSIGSSNITNNTVTAKSTIPPMVMINSLSMVVPPQMTSSTKATSRPTSSILQSTLLSGSNTLNKSKSSNVIDLTDDDEVTRVNASSANLLAIQRPVSCQKSTGQLLALNNTQSSVSQLLLVPTTLGQSTTALVVGGANSLTTGSTNMSPVATIRPSSSANRSSVRLINNQQSGVIRTRLLVPNSIVTMNRHPAPLPKTPPQQTGGFTKQLPPPPQLKLSRKDNSIVLSWNMFRTDDHEKIASYQLYAYQEGNSPPSSCLWKKVGSVKALELPMACTLTQFMPGHTYHFAVRAVDVRTRLGPFSMAKSIQLGAT